MHPHTVSDTSIFINTIISWSHGFGGRVRRSREIMPDPKAQVEVKCQNQVTASSKERDLVKDLDLGKDLVFEPHFHLSEILPLFPRSLPALRSNSCWSCLVPPACTALQFGSSGARCRSGSTWAHF